MSRSDQLVHDVITDRHRAWLANLPAQIEVAPGVLGFHGTPDDDVVYLLETVEPDGVRPATEIEVSSRLGSYPDRYQMLLCGHTHLQRSIRISSGTLVVNPGSVGWPAYADDHPYPHVIEAGTPHARYALIDDAAGQREVEFRAVKYPWDLAAQAARANDREDVARAVLTGRI